VVAGVAVVHGGGLVTTSYEYGLAVIALALVATFNLVRLRVQRDHGRIRRTIDRLV
jgi:hypothetical protein